MKLRFLIIIIIGISFVFVMCGDSHRASDGFVINGYFSKTKGETIYLDSFSTNKAIHIDSTVIDEDGRFSFKMKAENPNFYLLKIADDNFVTLIMSKGEVAEVTADVRQIANTYKIAGSEGSELLFEMNLHTRINYRRIDSIRKIWEDGKYKDDKLKLRAELDSISKIIRDDQADYLKDFINNNFKSLASLVALNQHFGREKLLEITRDFTYYDKVDNGLMETSPNNKHFLELHRKMTKYRRKLAEKEQIEKTLKIGALAPNITCSDINNENISLSSLRGKHVLLYFWASWFGPCRQENINLNKIYNKYKAKGFEIYSVSFDKHKNFWEKAIKHDKIEWITVCDQKGWDSPIAKLYNVDSGLYTVFLDPEGRIIAKGLEGLDLEMRIDEAFGQLAEEI